MGLYYNRDGATIEMQEWMRLIEDQKYSRVARTKVMDSANPSTSFDISTIWLGSNHQFGDGTPLIFETMIFTEDSDLDQYCNRYSTEKQAREGHTAAVVEATLGMFDPAVIDVDE